MPRTPETLARHELVGLAVRVVDAPNEDLVGHSGRVIRESMRTIVIEDRESGRIRRLPKHGTTFRFELPEGDVVEVEGDRLLARPARRTESRGESPWL